MHLGKKWFWRKFLKKWMKVLLYNPESSILNRGIVMQYIPLEKKLYGKKIQYLHIFLFITALLIFNMDKKAQSLKCEVFKDTVSVKNLVDIS